MFNTICYWLNRIGLSWLVAVLRWVLVTTVARGVALRAYTHVEDVGYAGWIETPRLGVLTFKRLDGTLQYRW